jgi:hypothetical protein
MITRNKISVQAGIQIRVCMRNRNYAKSWIPAFAGMTKEEDFDILVLDLIWHLNFGI